MSDTSEKKEKKTSPVSVKGMHDLIGDTYHAYQGFFEKAAEVALYYGCIPIETPVMEHEEVFTRSLGEETDIMEKEMYTLRTKGGDRLAIRPEGTAATMRAYLEHGMHTWHQPVMLYRYGPFWRHENPQRGRLREHRQFNIEIIGTPKSIADAMVIRMLVIILDEAGIKDLSVEINSIGDRECRPGYIKHLTTYYRKHINDICNNCRQRMKTNPLRVLDCKDPACAEIKMGAPESISSLCAGCKKHFREVLEYLEALSVPYTINHHLVRGLDYYTKTVFEIVRLPQEEKETEAKEGPLVKPAAPLALGSGGRYDDLARGMGSKRDVSAVGGAIGVDRIMMEASRAELDPRIVKKPKAYFIQIGAEAKLKSLSVIEILRKAKIPIAHSISKDGLGAQLAVAEKLGIPYALIFGQKEAIDETVIVRDMQSRSQDTVSFTELAGYMKKMK